MTISNIFSILHHNQGSGMLRVYARTHTGRAPSDMRNDANGTPRGRGFGAAREPSVSRVFAFSRRLPLTAGAKGTGRTTRWHSCLLLLRLLRQTTSFSQGLHCCEFLHSSNHDVVENLSKYSNIASACATATPAERLSGNILIPHHRERSVIFSTYGCKPERRRAVVVPRITFTTFSAYHL